MPLSNCKDLPFSASRTVSWVHIGDTHLLRSGEQNERDLGRIVDEVNALAKQGGLDFVFIPGDIADDGSAQAYEVFRGHLDRLTLPWCAIVGDHDVHERSFTHFQHYVEPELLSSFVIGPYRFVRLNAFSQPAPDAFAVDHAQLQWLERELEACVAHGQSAVLLLHCYPSDLKNGGEELAALLRRYPVLLVDMGHTHYNEISNDGDTLYSATRSTGQVEEGAVGYSVTTLDNNHVSWHFVELGSPGLVAVTAPPDTRLVTSRTRARANGESLEVRAKVWSAEPVERVWGSVQGSEFELARAEDGLWTAQPAAAGHGELRVCARTHSGVELASSVRVGEGAPLPQERNPRDQDNALTAWPERGILGTQLGPNKNGRKW